MSWIKPGESGASKTLRNFLETKLSRYETDRNDPNRNGQSNLSPYLHFGQIGASRVALEVMQSMQDAGAFLEELIVRRELSDNFCYYNPNYDDVQGFPDLGEIDPGRACQRQKRVPLQIEKSWRGAKLTTTSGTRLNWRWSGAVRCTAT